MAAVRDYEDEAYVRDGFYPTCTDCGGTADTICRSCNANVCYLCADIDGEICIGCQAVATARGNDNETHFT